jgi:homoserine kinase
VTTSGRGATAGSSSSASPTRPTSSASGPAGLDRGRRAPELEIETATARALLGSTVPLVDAIRQWANLGTLVDALHRGDFAQLSRSLEDTIAEPRRCALVPRLAAIKQAAVGAGALGCSLSGIGAVSLRVVP